MVSLTLAYSFIVHTGILAMRSLLWTDVSCFKCFDDQTAFPFVHELRYFVRMKINVESCTMIAEWAWDVKEGDDVCGICHSAYDGCCPNCKRPGDDCPLIWGECSHVFHLHCILTWFQSSTRGENCPMDRKPWQTAKAPLE